MNRAIRKSWLKLIDQRNADTAEVELLPDEPIDAMTQSVRNQSELGRMLVADHQVDVMLRDLAEFDDDATDFVNRCLLRLDRAVGESNVEVAKPNPSASAESTDLLPQIRVAVAEHPRRVPRRAWGPRTWGPRNWVARVGLAACLCGLVCAGIVWVSNQPRERGVAEEQIGKRVRDNRPSVQPDENAEPSGSDPNGSGDPVIPELPRPELVERDLEPRSLQPIGQFKIDDFAVVELDRDAKVLFPDEREGSLSRFSLEDGLAKLRFEDGHAVQLRSPVSVDVRAPDHIFVESGQVLANVASRPDEFLIEGPDGLASTREGAVLVDVDPGQDTRMSVESGKFELRPWSDQQGRKIELDSDGLDEVRLASASDRGPGLSFLEASGAGDRFAGFIDFDGDTIELQSRDAWRQLFERANQRLAEGPEQFHDEWSQFARRIGRDDFNATLTINGQSTQFDSLERLLDPDEWKDTIPLVGNSDQSPENSGGRVFAGSIHVNGQKMEFDSKEEFEKAHRELFGPFFARPLDWTGSDGVNNQQSNFHGELNINGERKVFTDREEFEKARRQMKLDFERQFNSFRSRLNGGI